MMRGGQAYRRYSKDLEEAAKEEKDKEVIKNLLVEEDKVKKSADLKEEVVKLREINLKLKANVVMVESTNKSSEKRNPNFAGLQGGRLQRGTVKRKTSKAEERRLEQRKRLKDN